MLDILLVEDDELIADFERSLMNDYNVTVASTGKEAIEHAKKHNIDLLMQDVLLPDANGCQVALQIANLQNNVVVAFITGKPDLISEKEFLALKGHKNVLHCLVWDKNKRVSYKIPEIVRLVGSVKAFVTEDNNKRQKHKPFSNQEIKILDCMKKDMSNKEIALKLNISDKTVSEYKRRAMEKLKTACFSILFHPFVLELLDLEPTIESIPF